MPTGGARVGVEPLDNVFLFECHDQAWHLWKEASVRDRVLIHIDAHHDAWPLAGPVTIANFIWPALAEGLVREAWWVVPDDSVATLRGRRAILHLLREIARRANAPAPALAWRGGSCRATVAGKPFTVTTLRQLPRFDENVLLDIDTDFMVIPRVQMRRDCHSPLPWCWPEELVGKLAESGLRCDLATIAYSVEGGFTPLRWKYLGEEVARRIRRPDDSAPNLMREAAEAEAAGDAVPAESFYRRAIELQPESAAPVFRLALLTASPALYHRARALDASYRTPYNSAGFHLVKTGRYREAEAEHRQILQLDPEDRFALFGLSQIAAHRKDWPHAEQYSRKALALEPGFLDAQIALAEALRAQHRLDEAVQAFESALRLGLAGKARLGEPIMTRPGGPQLRDPWHYRLHARLAGLYARRNELDRAVTAYRIALGFGLAGPAGHLRLAFLHLRNRNGRQFLSGLGDALRQTPATIRHLRRSAAALLSS